MSASISQQHTPNASHIRLTRRGRVVVLAVLVAVLFAAFSLGRSASQASPPTGLSSPAPAQNIVTVQAGESLWTMAQRVAPDNDPREVVAQIRDLNGLASAQLVPGQQLLLPVLA